MQQPCGPRMSLLPGLNWQQEGLHSNVNPCNSWASTQELGITDLNYLMLQITNSHANRSPSSCYLREKEEGGDKENSNKLVKQVDL